MLAVALIAITVTAGFTGGAANAAYTAPDGAEVVRSTHTITFNQTPGRMTFAPDEIEAYNIGGSNYYKLRDLVKYLGRNGEVQNHELKHYNVEFDADANVVNLTQLGAFEDYVSDGVLQPLTAGVEGFLDNTHVKIPEAESITVTESRQKVRLDGETVDIQGYNINGNNYYKLRDLSPVLDFEIIAGSSQIKVRALPDHENPDLYDKSVENGVTTYTMKLSNEARAKLYGIKLVKFS